MSRMGEPVQNNQTNRIQNFRESCISSNDSISIKC